LQAFSQTPDVGNFILVWKMTLIFIMFENSNSHLSAHMSVLYIDACRQVGLRAYCDQLQVSALHSLV